MDVVNQSPDAADSNHPYSEVVSTACVCEEENIINLFKKEALAIKVDPNLAKLTSYI